MRLGGLDPRIRDRYVVRPRAVLGPSRGGSRMSDVASFFNDTLPEKLKEHLDLADDIQAVY